MTRKGRARDVTSCTPAASIYIDIPTAAGAPHRVSPLRMLTTVPASSFCCIMTTWSTLRTAQEPGSP
ncbi:hypothetical protein PG991_009118 [Apiospora marii]|uniref:Uncharacterized protein n=1 Tax=Apiospora marii TaxID=335849 RepID=A0ABR1RJQ9_9PEZI